jgi:hypothetical protein
MIDYPGTKNGDTRRAPRLTSCVWFSFDHRQPPMPGRSRIQRRSRLLSSTSIPLS